MNAKTFITPLQLIANIFPIIWTVIAIFKTDWAYMKWIAEKGMALDDVESSNVNSGNLIIFKKICERWIDKKDRLIT